MHSGRSGRIDVHYKIEEGIAPLFSGSTSSATCAPKIKCMRREVVVNPGDVFNTVRVDISKKRLENFGLLRQGGDLPGRDWHRRPQEISTCWLQEKRTGSLSFGGGFSTIDNLVFFAELVRATSISPIGRNLTGGGQKFRLRIQLGTQRKDFLLDLIEPYFLDQRLSLGGQIFTAKRII